VYERASVVLAERLDIPLAYTTGTDVDRDPTVLAGASAIICLGHDEYWTPQQREKPENVCRYFKPSPEAIADLTGLLAPSDSTR
jgi:hypothetical protein